MPFMNKQELAIVSALVGAGGNLGAVIAGFCFYKTIDDPLLPFQVHAGYVMFWALLTPVYYWKEHGGMFHGPAEPIKDLAWSAGPLPGKLHMFLAKQNVPYSKEVKSGCHLPRFLQTSSEMLMMNDIVALFAGAK